MFKILELSSSTFNTLTPDLRRVVFTRRRPDLYCDCFLIVLVLNLQMDYLRTSQLETLEGSIERIQVSIEKFSSLGSILIMGDFYSRVGKHPDSVCQEGNKIITNDFSESSLCATQRKSFDNDLNNHGKRLLEICRSGDF